VIILLALGALVVVGLSIVRFSDLYSTTRPAGEIIAGLAGTFLLICLISIPLSRLSVYAGIEQVEAVRLTVESVREDGIPLESAAIQIKVAEMNQWLASAQYWRSSVFNIWWPKEIEDVRPIR